MSTVLVSTARSSTREETLRAVQDVRWLFRFRLAGLRGRARRAAPIALFAITLITLVFAVAPAFLPEYAVTRRDVLILLPTAYLGVLVISIVSAATSGGGRELLPREQAVAFPVSPTADHLGALLMAPLNIAWLIQAWVVLAATSYAISARPTLVLALLPVFVWLFAATAVAQALAWMVEWVRRGPAGTLAVRIFAVLLAGLAATLIATDTLSVLLDNSPTLGIAIGVIDGSQANWLPWLGLMLVLSLIAAVAVVLGALVNISVARRQARDELRSESSGRAPRPNPVSDFVALVRVDRTGIWRSVPMRRGMMVLAFFPGLVAVGGSFKWDMLGIFPGLVASGGALLFGVNSWCLDGRGALWRDSLPVGPRLVFASRAIVLLEILLCATAVTMVIASLRAGAPTVSQLVAVLCATVVVTVQVVATSLRWSVRRPYAVDMRSARATPAPPLVMVGYSTRLALATTFTGLLFNGASHAPWTWSLVLAVPFLLWSGIRLVRTADAWSQPETRSLVIATVAS